SCAKRSPSFRRESMTPHQGGNQSTTNHSSFSYLAEPWRRFGFGLTRIGTSLPCYKTLCRKGIATSCKPSRTTCDDRVARGAGRTNAALKLLRTPTPPQFCVLRPPHTTKPPLSGLSSGSQQNVAVRHTRRRCDAATNPLFSVAAKPLHQRLTHLTLLLVVGSRLRALASSLVERLEQPNGLILLRRVHDGIGAAQVERDLRVRLPTDSIGLLQRSNSCAIVLLCLVDIRKQRVDSVQGVGVLLHFLQ